MQDGNFVLHFLLCYNFPGFLFKREYKMKTKLKYLSGVFAVLFLCTSVAHAAPPNDGEGMIHWYCKLKNPEDKDIKAINALFDEYGLKRIADDPKGGGPYVYGWDEKSDKSVDRLRTIQDYRMFRIDYDLFGYVDVMVAKKKYCRESKYFSKLTTTAIDTWVMIRELDNKKRSDEQSWKLRIDRDSGKSKLGLIKHREYELKCEKSADEKEVKYDYSPEECDK